MRRHALALALPLAAAFACSRASEPVESVSSAIDPVDRKIIGEAVSYAPDESLRAMQPKLARSMKERRRVAWDIARRVLAPVGTAEGAPLPKFQTWYSSRDFATLAGRAMNGLTAEERASGAPIPSASLDALFPWLAGDGATSNASWSYERYLARRRELQEPSGAASVAASEARTLLSPSLTRGLLESYARAGRCWNGTPASCVEGERFARDAVAVKMAWADSSQVFRVHDTSAAKLEGVLDAGTWGEGEAMEAPGSERIYTMHRLSDPTRPESLPQTMRMQALHIATKELDDWFWITLWWSPEPDTDFGADRPASFGDLAPAWSNYKMCAVVDYDELDEDPDGGFTETHPSLAAALRTTRMRPDATARSWCSNPYLEEGERNAPTNCIGCHQHAGLRRPGPKTIRLDEARFPENTRTRVRTDFPYDYVWTTTAGTELARVLAEAR